MIWQNSPYLHDKAINKTQKECASTWGRAHVTESQLIEIIIIIIESWKTCFKSRDKRRMAIPKISI